MRLKTDNSACTPLREDYGNTRWVKASWRATIRWREALGPYCIPPCKRMHISNQRTCLAQERRHVLDELGHPLAVEHDVVNVEGAVGEVVRVQVLKAATDRTDTALDSGKTFTIRALLVTHASVDPCVKPLER